jgi:cell migration-inducing and hyaluronan-binding protein
VGAGAELRVETSRESLQVSLNEMDTGSAVILEFPGYASATGGVEAASLDALRTATETTFFKDGDSLWAKLVVDNEAGLEIAPGSNAPPGFAPRAIPVGAFIEVRKEGLGG